METEASKNPKPSSTVDGGVEPESPTLFIPMESSESEFSAQPVALNSDTDFVEPKVSIPFQKEYAIQGQIARGGMGRIFSATDSKLEREVALKVSTSGQSGEDHAFSMEAKVLAELEHPNILPVHDLGQIAEGRWFYSMKLIRGKTLSQVIRELKSADEQAVV